MMAIVRVFMSRLPEGLKQDAEGVPRLVAT